MRIGILTTSLHNNYGGLLQAYALQNVLRNLGHDVWILQREHKKSYLFFMRICKRLIYAVKRKYYVTDEDRKMLSENMLNFTNKYICPKSPFLYSNKQLRKFVMNSQIEAIVVGSDQVWRPTYIPNVTNYFLDFIEDRDIKRIAYAASFGVDLWEFVPRDTKKCKQLAQKFDAISVRESSGVQLCEQYLNVEAQHVLDPTFLFEKEFYEKLIVQEKERLEDGDMFCYVLDKSKEKQKIIELISNKLGYVPYCCMPKEISYKEMTEQNKSDFIYPPVTRWLRSFYDAKLILTDSFHGCVFSIIFNKPFWVIPNVNRGTTRFVSLLRIFRLENRIINVDNLLQFDWQQSIDWESVNEIRNSWKEKSMNFLRKSLLS